MSFSGNRDEVMDLVREHLVNELELKPEQITESARFKEDFDADSLDLYELVMELEDQYGISVSEQEAGQISTVRDAVDFVMAKAGS
ncbi:MAG: acyl carrier protein [Thermoleophilia bacterium]|nr:acyl carrier protein [Thermoleophilia bacterium]